MNIRDLMTKPVVTCRSTDMLDCPARLMWEFDCGVIPVVKEDGRMAGIVTDRDICMAAYTQGRTLHAIPVRDAMAKNVFSCHADDSFEAAESIMKDNQVRRLPVLDRDDRPIGVISLSDIARYAVSLSGKDSIDRELTRSLAAISQPRRPGIESAPKTPLAVTQQPALVGPRGPRPSRTAH